MKDTSRPGWTRVGRGRSGVVYREHRAGDAGDRAVKVFVGDRLAKLVMYVLTGAPNPYGWSRDAVRCAAARRNLLASLVPCWTDGQVAVAGDADWGWHPRFKTHQLGAEFIDGRPAALQTPFSAGRPDERRELVHEVMRPLQKQLRRFGLDGLLWQSGFGNPVAGSNFLRGGRDARWTWIDLESGVPALFPLNPLRLIGFYLPRSIHHRHPLFDDVDIPRLRVALEADRSALQQRLGDAGWREITQLVDELERHQRRWRRIRRPHRSIRYQHSKGRITDEQRRWYSRHVARWYAREIARGIPSVLETLGEGVRQVGRLVARIPWRRAARGLLLTCTSQAYRTSLARRYVAARIDRWRRRRQLAPSEAAFLRARTNCEEAATYLTDFGMHIAIKPFVKVFQYVIMPPLIFAGVINPVLGALLIVCGGAIGRTLYTAWRCLDATFRRARRPWVALVAGTLPIVGNAAFPIQIMYSGSAQDAVLARFILFDSITAVGELIPIWGGPDTITEHFFNRVAQTVVRVVGGHKGVRPLYLGA